MRPDAPLLHPNLRTDSMGKKEGTPSNIGKFVQFKKGDIEQGFAEASVVIERRAASVAMAVSDDGQGFDVGAVLAASQQAGHMGLHGMRERALLLDGTLAISSVPGAGTRVLAEVPLPDGA